MYISVYFEHNNNIALNIVMYSYGTGDETPSSGGTFCIDSGTTYSDVGGGPFGL
jgi:hypothetical protein